MKALLLGGNHLATTQGSGFEDAFKAKLRLAVGLLCGPLCLWARIGLIGPFWFAHFDLIGALTAKPA